MNNPNEHVTREEMSRFQRFGVASVVTTLIVMVFWLALLLWPYNPDEVSTPIGVEQEVVKVWPNGTAKVTLVIEACTHINQRVDLRVLLVAPEAGGAIELTRLDGVQTVEGCRTDRAPFPLRVPPYVTDGRYQLVLEVKYPGRNFVQPPSIESYHTESFTLARKSK